MGVRNERGARARKCWPFLALAGVLWAVPASAHPVHSRGQQQPGASATARSADQQANQEPQGIANFGEVTSGLYRGAQPSRRGYAELKRLGFTTVVTFRGEHKLDAREKEEVEGLGMRFVVIPWSARHQPSDAQVAEFLQLVRPQPGQKIYLHCLRGADRTGVMVATYRIAIDKWDADRAVQEMYEYHFWRHLLPHLKSYVMNFPKLLAESPVLHAALVAAPAQAQ